MAKNFKRIEKGINFKGQTSVPTNPGDGDVYFDATTTSLKLYKNGAWIDLGSGSGSGMIKVNYYNPVVTTLPTGANPIVDGQTIVENDLVFFTNLSVDNNVIYLATEVATGVVWVPQSMFNSSLNPTPGDIVYVISGDIFSNQVVYFNQNAEFLINDVIKMFNGDRGTDFVELGSIKTIEIDDGSSGDVFSVNPMGSENWIISFSVVRGSAKSVGHIYLTTVDGTEISLATSGSDLADVGLTFSASFDGSDIKLEYDAESMGDDLVLKYWTARWSDLPGGPSGTPNYTSVTSTLNLPTLPPVGSIIAYNPGYYTNSSNGTFIISGPANNNAAAVNAYLPNNWKVCNGAEINDAASPIWNTPGRFLPNLTDSRFFMGSNAAGGVGGNNSSAHTHSVTSNVTPNWPTVTVNAHTHGIAHVHQVTFRDNAGDHWGPTTQNNATSTFNASGMTALYSGAYFTTPPSPTTFNVTPTTGANTQFYTGGVLSAPSGIAATARSGTANVATTTVSGGSLTNSAVTSGAASATENRPAYLSTFYIIRIK